MKDLGNALLDEETNLTLGQKIADKVTQVMGSWKFIIFQTAFITVWMILNVIAYTTHWDPYPWILLNLIFSVQAAYSAPLIMMSQNRQSQKDSLILRNDYISDLKAEKILMTLQKEFTELKEKVTNLPSFK